MSTWSSRSAKRNPRARKSHTFHMPAPHITKVSGAWGALTGVFGLLAFTVQSVTLIVLALVSLAGLIVTTFGGEKVAVQTRRASTERRPSPGGKPRARRAPSKPGTKPTGRGKCNARCHTSVAPKSECECKSSTCSHGSESGVLATGASRKPKTPTRAELKSRLAKQQERKVVRQQRKATS